MAAHRVGVDIGGTFTDFSVMNAETGAIFGFKTPTVNSSPSDGVANGLRLLSKEYGVDPSTVAYFVHGSTIATNTLIQRAGSRLALFVTEGFRDLLNIARLRLPVPFNLNANRPPPLIPRECVFPIKERLRSDGSEEIELDAGSLARALDAAVAAAVDGIVICFLHSYRNPVHEQQAKEWILARRPDLHVSCSAEVWPEIREYERAMLATMNAYVHDNVVRYLDKLEHVVHTAGTDARPYMTKLNGGVTTVRAAASTPVQLLLSGPASGVIGATYLAQLAGFRDLITLDIGGTSADIAIIEGGQVRLSTTQHIGDFPLSIPVVGVSSIGAGGGSIAWIDAAGVLKVGPRSAGANPGPACYGQGGELPALSDAFLLCGFLNGDRLLGGRVRLYPELAARAIGSLTDQMGLGLVETAGAVVDVATAQMYAEFSNVLARQGVDRRDFSLVAFGGAGPVLACFIARELHIPTVIVPPSPGTLCALGALMADVREDYVRTVMRRLDAMSADDLASGYEELARQAEAWLSTESPGIESHSVHFAADMRYVGQAYEIQVSVDPAWVQRRDFGDLAEAAHRQHLAEYGHADPSAPLEMVNLRAQLVGLTSKVELRPTQRNGTHARVRDRRAIFYDRASHDAAIYERTDLPAGCEIRGPAVIEQDDTTTVIPAGFIGRVDDYGNLVIRG